MLAGAKVGCVRRQLRAMLPYMVAYARLCPDMFGPVRHREVQLQTDCRTPCNGGFKVAVGCSWWRRVIGECNFMLLVTV